MPTTVWLNAVHEYNTGATFSFRCGPILADGRCWFFIALALIVCPPLSWCLLSHKAPACAVASGCTRRPSDDPRVGGLASAWAFSLAATRGALFLGEVMGMTPCLLCWYQRILMFPLAPILGIAAFTEDRRGAVYALPLALGGLGVAAYHCAVAAGWVPAWWVPCGAGPSCSDQKLTILHGIQLPWLSLVAFALTAACLVTYLRKTRS